MTHTPNHRIISVYEEELNRIVLDVHDGPVQNLFAVLSILMRVQNEIDKSDPESHVIAPQVQQVIDLVEDSLQEIRSFLGTFRSPEFQRRSLEAIFRSLILQHEEWSGQTVELDLRPLPTYVDYHVKIALYRILQEALSNTFRHAAVDHIWVKIWSEERYIYIQVLDYGKGFNPPPLVGPDATEREEHIGLRGMRDRIQLVGGEFNLESSPGHGTRIHIKVPANG